MNPYIQDYFDQIERMIFSSTAVQECHVLRMIVTQYAGQIRLRAILMDGGLLEVFEHVNATGEDALVVNKYRYHWQDSTGRLLRRWDSSAHHLHLPNAPHHVHLPDGSVVGVADPPDVVTLLAEIEMHHHEGGLV